MGNDSVLVKFGEKRKGRRRGEKPGRRNMGRSPGSYWGERVRVGWDLYFGVAQVLFILGKNNKNLSKHLDHTGSVHIHH